MALLLGGLVGFFSRLIIFGQSSNEKVMDSSLGLVAFIIIGLGLFGVLGVVRAKAWLSLSLPLFALTAGLMWVVPFPH